MMCSLALPVEFILMANHSSNEGSCPDGQRLRTADALVSAILTGRIVSLRFTAEISFNRPHAFPVRAALSCSFRISPISRNLGVWVRHAAGAIVRTGSSFPFPWLHTPSLSASDVTTDALLRQGTRLWATLSRRKTLSDLVSYSVWSTHPQPAVGRPAQAKAKASARSSCSPSGARSVEPSMEVNCT